jgi:drug/metabolite transporter (DMT)-like permease
MIVARTDHTLAAVYLRMVLAQIFWSGAFVASEIALATQPPSLTAVVRFVLTTAIYALLCATIGRGERTPLSARLRLLTPSDWGALVAMGFFGVALYTLLVHRGLAGSTAASAGLLIPTIQPIFTALLSRILFRDAVTGALVAGLALGLTGAGLVVGGGAALGGDLVIVAAALSFSCYAVAGKRAPASLSAMEATTLSFAFGTVLLLPVPFIMGETIALASAKPAFWLAIGFLVVFATVLPYLWWTDAVRRIGSARTGVFTFLMPPMAVLMAALVLGQNPSAQQLTGGVLALFGVALATLGWPTWRSSVMRRVWRR